MQDGQFVEQAVQLKGDRHRKSGACMRGAAVIEQYGLGSLTLLGRCRTAQHQRRRLAAFEKCAGHLHPLACILCADLQVLSDLFVTHVLVGTQHHHLTQPQRQAVHAGEQRCIALLLEHIVFGRRLVGGAGLLGDGQEQLGVDLDLWVAILAALQIDGVVAHDFGQPCAVVADLLLVFEGTLPGLEHGTAQQLARLGFIAAHPADAEPQQKGLMGRPVQPET